MELELRRDWWMHDEDFIEDMADIGYRVTDINDEYAIFTSEDEEDEDEWVCYFDTALSTKWIREVVKA